MRTQITSLIFHRKVNRGNSRHVCLDRYLTVSSHGLSVAENWLCVRATAENKSTEIDLERFDVENDRCRVRSK